MLETPHQHSPHKVLYRLPSTPQFKTRPRDSTHSSDDDRTSFTTAHDGIVGRLSPGLHSPNLYASSASGLSSPCSSNASSTFLTPPHTPDAPRQRPWKASSSLDPGLNMLHQPRRRSSTGSDMYPRRRHKRHHKHECRAHRAARAKKESRMAKRPSHGWLPVRKASTDATNESSSAVDKRISIQYNNHTGRRGVEAALADPRSAPAEPLVSRHWTSVGLDSGLSAGQEDPDSHNDHRGSSDRRDSSERILDFVCSRLSARRVSLTQLDTPASITLRRASAMRTSIAERKLSTLTNLTSEAITPLNLDEFEDHDHQNEVNANCPLSAYLITNKDIEHVAQVIHEAFRTRGASSAGEPIFSKAPEAPEYYSATEHVDNKPSVVSDGILPQTSQLSKIAATVATTFGESSVTYNSSKKRKSSTVQRVYTTNGVNEVIWEDISDSSDSSTETNIKSVPSTLTMRSPSMILNGRWHGRRYGFNEDTGSTRNGSQTPTRLVFGRGWRTRSSPSISAATSRDLSRVNSFISPSNRGGELSRVNSDIYTSVPVWVNHSRKRSRTASDSSVRARLDTSNIEKSSKGHNVPEESVSAFISQRKETDLRSPSEELPDIAETPEQEERSTESSRRTSGASSSPDASPDSQRRSSYVLREVSYFPSAERKRTQVGRMGSAIGASCRARRRSSMPGVSWVSARSGTYDKSARFDEANLNGHEKRKTWKKPRKDSGWPGLNSEDRTTEDRTRSMSAFDEYEDVDNDE